MPSTANNEITRFFADPREYRLGAGAGVVTHLSSPTAGPDAPSAPALGLTRRPVVMEDKDEMPTTTSTALRARRTPGAGR